MYQSGSRPSLGYRIVEAQRRRYVETAQDRPPRRRTQSFSEQYRGTSFAAPTVTTHHAQPMSRGRLFVLVSGLALAGTGAMFVVGPLL